MGMYVRGENHRGNRTSQPARPGILDGFNQQEAETMAPKVASHG